MSFKYNWEKYFLTATEGSNFEIIFVLLVMFTLTSAMCPILIYFITSGTLMLVLLPIIITFSVMSGNILITITMEMFPTAFR